MTKRRRGVWIRRIVIGVVAAPAVAVAIVVVYILANITQAAFAEWSPKVQAAVIGGIAVVLLAGQRLLSRGRAARDLEQLRSAAQGAGAAPPVAVPSPAPAAAPMIATSGAARARREGTGMVAKRKRKQDRDSAVEELQRQLLASAEETRTALEAATARMEALLVGELERGHHFQTAMQSAIEGLQQAAAANALDVSRAMGRVAEMCGLVAERIEADRVDRRELAEADRRERRELAEAERVDRRELAEADRRERRELAEADRTERRALTEALAALSAPPRPLEAPSRVLGGTIFSGRERFSAHDHAATNGGADLDVSIVDDDPWGPVAVAHPAADVRSRDEACWIGGIEIADVKRENDRTRYWLRRRSDGYIFPRAFDAEDLRFDHEPEVEGAQEPGDGDTGPDAGEPEVAHAGQDHGTAGA